MEFNSIRRRSLSLAELSRELEADMEAGSESDSLMERIRASAPPVSSIAGASPMDNAVLRLYRPGKQARPVIEGVVPVVEHENSRLQRSLAFLCRDESCLLCVGIGFLIGAVLAVVVML